MEIGLFEDKLESWWSFLTKERHVSPHTVKSYHGDMEQLRLFWRRILKEEKRKIVFKEIIQRYITALFYRKIAKTSLARKLSCIRSFAHFLKSEGIELDFDVKSPRIDRKLPIVLSVDEIFYVLDSLSPDDLPTKYPYRDRALFELIYATGARCSEVIAIRLTDIDFEERRIRIVGKGRRDRFVLFGKKAHKALSLYIKKERGKLVRFKRTEQLFLNCHGGPLTSRSVQRIFEMFRRCLRIDRKLTPHKLRHSFATHLLSQGVDLRVIKELLGHKTLASTEIYTHVSSAQLAQMCDEKHPLNDLGRLVDDDDDS